MRLEKEVIELRFNIHALPVSLPRHTISYRKVAKKSSRYLKDLP